MNDAYVVALDGLSAERSLADLPKDVLKMSARAVNRTADRARTQAAREILKQVALPPSYLQPSGGRLTVTKKASETDVEAIITGRTRPTSLARYAGSSTAGLPDISVTVAPGFARRMRRAFLIRLRAGRADLDTKSNLGLAIRLKPGETIQHRRLRLQPIGENLYLLYGPSVSQLFNTVREDIGPDTQDFLAAEFARLMEL